MVSAFSFGRLWSTTSEVLLSIDRALCFNRLEAATSGVLLSILRFVLVDFGGLHQKYSSPSSIRIVSFGSQRQQEGALR